MKVPVQIGPLLTDKVLFLERYPLPHEHAATVTSHWIAHTHVFDCFEETP